MSSPSLQDKFCDVPFTFFDFGSKDAQEQVHLCCPRWIKKSIGRFPASSFWEVWNSKDAQEIRESILDGSFRFCDKTRCPKISSGELPNRADITDEKMKFVIQNKITNLDFLPKILNLSNDRSCNLTCPSCRNQKIDIREGNEFEEMQTRQNKLFETVLPGLEVLQVTGTGDPFGSKLYRDLLTNLEGEKYPKLKIYLNSNGQMFTPKMWRQLEKIHDRIDGVMISVDAARDATYADIRVGGTFSRLVENLQFLGEQRKQKKFGWLRLDFVVQQKNYTEMRDFIHLGEAVGADSVFFQKIINWGTYSESEFKKQAIWQEDHPEYENFLAQFRHPDFAQSFVWLGNCFEFWQKANASSPPLLPRAHLAPEERA